MEPPSPPQEVFSRRASYYATSKVHDDQETLTWLADAAAPSTEDVALDVATGTGHAALALAPRVLRVEGIDVTEEMLAEARKLAAQRGIINIRFLTGISTALPYPDRSFDIVTCRRAVHHFIDVPTSLGEMARVLKIGGRLVIDDRVVPEDDEIDSLINQLDRLHDPSHIRSRRGCELTALVERTGLELIASRPYRRRMPLSHFTQMVPPLTAQRMRDLVTGADKRVRKALDVRTVNGHLYFDNHFLLITAAKAV